MSEDRTEALIERMLARDRTALARLMTLVENRAPELPAIMSRVYGRTGHAHVIGLTGPPGAGKSTLADRLTAHLRAAERRVGIVAVDPSSPFSGGAVLGDRIRMADTGTDPGVFIRSMATRGHLGGLALATFDAVKVLDAFGIDLVFVETVGAGQSEVDIASRAHTTAVVQMPQSGDAVQALKAGILEIGDLYVVNKTDLGGADSMASNLDFMLEERQGWRPPVIQTSAVDGKGIKELADAINKHYRYLKAGAGWRRRESDRARKELFESMRRLLAETFADETEETGFEETVGAIVARREDARSAAKRLLQDLELPK